MNTADAEANTQGTVVSVPGREDSDTMARGNNRAVVETWNEEDFYEWLEKESLYSPRTPAGSETPPPWVHIESPKYPGAVFLKRRNTHDDFVCKVYPGHEREARLIEGSLELMRAATEVVDRVDSFHLEDVEDQELIDDLQVAVDWIRRTS